MTREEAIEFGNMWLQINEDCKDSHTYAFFQMALKSLEQEPKTGYWIMGEKISDGYTCSKCGTKYKEYPISYNCCPNCGSRNEVKNDEKRKSYNKSKANV